MQNSTMNLRGAQPRFHVCIRPGSDTEESSKQLLFNVNFKILFPTIWVSHHILLATTWAVRLVHSMPLEVVVGANVGIIVAVEVGALRNRPTACVASSWAVDGRMTAMVTSGAMFTVVLIVPIRFCKIC